MSSSLKVNTITDKAGTGSPSFPNPISFGSTATFGGKINGAIQTAIFEHQLPAGTGGGTNSAANGQFIVRPLNQTLRNDDSFATLLNSVITLNVGSYIFYGSAVMYGCNTSQLRIRNTSDNITVGVGYQAYTPPGTMSIPDVYSSIVTIASSKNFELQYRVQTTDANGLGNFSTTFDEVSVYARLIIEKVA